MNFVIEFHDEAAPSFYRKVKKRLETKIYKLEELED